MRAKTILLHGYCASCACACRHEPNFRRLKSGQLIFAAIPALILAVPESENATLRNQIGAILAGMAASDLARLHDKLTLAHQIDVSDNAITIHVVPRDLFLRTLVCCLRPIAPAPL